MAKLWGFRAGKHGERENSAISDGALYPGFPEDKDFRELATFRDILNYLIEIRSGEKHQSLYNYAAQRNQFVHQFSVGDYVIMPFKGTRDLAIGEITGNYIYDSTKDDDFKHYRTVVWRPTSVSRDELKGDLRASLGASQTIFGISRNNALERVKAILDGEKDPGYNLGNQGLMSNDTIDSEEDQGKIEELAIDQIVKRIKDDFVGHELTHLVNDILRAEGYTTRVSPPGRDEGVDILAAKGSLGFDDDSLCVQVKSGDKPADHHVVLYLVDSMKRTKARKGLLVSTSGVDTAARNDLKNRFFEVRLWEMSDLLNQIFRVYDKLSGETRSKLPLKQIWIPIPEDEE